MKTWAQKKSPALEFKIGNVLNFDQADQSVDAVFMSGILHHIPPVETGG